MNGGEESSEQGDFQRYQYLGISSSQRFYHLVDGPIGLETRASTAEAAHSTRGRCAGGLLVAHVRLPGAGLRNIAHRDPGPKQGQ